MWHSKGINYRSLSGMANRFVDLLRVATSHTTVNVAIRMQQKRGGIRVKWCQELL
jgi:hypothetical protein